MSFRGFFLSLTIVAILMFSAFGTTIPVFADDGTTTQVADSSTPAPTADESSPAVTEVAPQAATDVATEEATPQPTDAATEEAAPQPTDVATEEATSQPTDVATEVSTPTAPALEQLPENTTVTIVDSNGDAQPLATQDSADAITSAYDPIWCPAGQSPTPGANGCTSSFSSFDALLTYLKANESDTNYQQAGTIYIQNGQYLGGESKIDFNTYFNPTNTTSTSLNNYNLTLQGGWNTSDNTVTDTTKFNIPVIVGSSSNPWFGSLNFNNLVISGVSNQTGLTAYSQQNITLSNVEVTNSQTGADLNASGRVRIDKSKFNNNKKAGVNIQSGSLTYITDSEFNGNGQGLGVNSSNSVVLANVLANSNGKFGADIAAVFGVEIYDSIFSGNVSYTYNCKGKTATGGYGLKVLTTDYVYAEGLQANDNYEFGASLNGSSVEVYSGETITNNTFNGNGHGLDIHATDYVTIFDTQANNNKKYGADIQAVNDVNLANSFFNGNKDYICSCNGTTYYGYGLQVVTTGNIGLTNVSASDNNLFGAHLDGYAVNIYKGTFDANGANTGKTFIGKGLEIISATHVNLDNVEANNNHVFGTDIKAQGDVDISNSFFNGNKVYTYTCKNQSSATGGYGLQVVTNGAILVSEIEASNNYTFGAYLSGLSVSISKGIFNANSSESSTNVTGMGLGIESASTVNLTNVEASNNQLYGADIKATGAVSISTGIFNGNVAYTGGYCGGKTYYGYGIKIVTTDTVSMNHVTADKNNLYGAHVEGGNIYVNFSSFSNNGTGNLSDHLGKGLEIVSTGTSKQVSLYQVNANNNQLFGADIQAEDAYVSVSDSIFNGNVSYTSSNCKGKTYDGYGLKVVTKNNDIFLFDVTANKNGLYGAHLEGVNVFVEADTGLVNTFNENGSGDPSNPTGKGLEVVSTGTVTFDSVEANNNQLFGADVQAAGDVSITNSVFSGNVYYTSGTCKNKTYNGYGLKVVAPENSITVDNVTANDNGLFGATLEGSQVTVTNSTFNNNKASSGLIITGGDVTLDNVTATGNGADGVTICKADSVAATNSTFTDNKAYGLKVASPVFSESGNTYLNNGSGSLFYNSTTCTPASNNNGNNNNNNQHNKWWGNWWTNWWKGYGHNNWHGGFYGGKNCHSFGK